MKQRRSPKLRTFLRKVEGSNVFSVLYFDKKSISILKIANSMNEQWFRH